MKWPCSQCWHEATAKVRRSGDAAGEGAAQGNHGAIDPDGDRIATGPDFPDHLERLPRHADIGDRQVVPGHVRFAHCVASPGKYIAIVSTTVETADPIAEIAPGLALVGEVMER